MAAGIWDESRPGSSSPSSAPPPLPGSPPCTPLFSDSHFPFPTQAAVISEQQFLLGTGIHPGTSRACVHITCTRRWPQALPLSQAHWSRGLGEAEGLQGAHVAKSGGGAGLRSETSQRQWLPRGHQISAQFQEESHTYLTTYTWMQGIPGNDAPGLCSI